MRSFGKGATPLGDVGPCVAAHIVSGQVPTFPVDLYFRLRGRFDFYSAVPQLPIGRITPPHASRLSPSSSRRSHRTPRHQL